MAYSGFFRWVGSFSLLMIAGQGGAADLPSNAPKWDGRIVEARTHLSLSLDELALRLIPVSNVLIGERHYSASVQKAEGAIIRAVVNASGSQSSFTTAWEFLNFSDQEKTDPLFAQVVAGTMSAAEFLKLTQSTDRAVVYAPLLDVTRELGGKLLGVNLSRDQKAPVLAGGIGALDPSLLPPGFALGSAGYSERFFSAMEGHTTPEKIQRYYEAQCLTDDVMAYRLLENASTPKKFLIAGSFHTEYFDGAVARVHTRLAAQPALPQGVVTIRIYDASDYADEELEGLLRDAKYGEVADYVFFVNEPLSKTDFQSSLQSPAMRSWSKFLMID